MEEIVGPVAVVVAALFHNQVWLQHQVMGPQVLLPQLVHSHIGQDLKVLQNQDDLKVRQGLTNHMHLNIHLHALIDHTVLLTQKGQKVLFLIIQKALVLLVIVVQRIQKHLINHQVM